MMYLSLAALIFGGPASAGEDLIVPDEEDLDFELDTGDCNIKQQCKGKPGRTCDAGDCNLADGWVRQCEIGGVLVFCWGGLGDPNEACGDLVGLGVEAQMGTIKPDMLSCLDGMVQDPASSKRLEASKILLTFAQKTLDERWEKWARRHADLTPNDGNLLLDLSERALAKKDLDVAMALADKAMAASEKTWTSTLLDKKAFRIHQIKVEAGLAKARAGGPPDVKEVREWARTWYYEAVETKQDPKAALTACVKAGGESAWCKREGHWADAPETP